MIDILAGDFGRKTSARIQRTLDARPKCLVLPRGRAGEGRQEVSFERITWIEAVTEANAHRLGGRLVWGLAAWRLGPLGGLARMVDGDTRGQVLFALVLADGRKLLGKTPAVEFGELSAAASRRTGPAPWHLPEQERPLQGQPRAGERSPRWLAPSWWLPPAG